MFKPKLRSRSANSLTFCVKCDSYFRYICWLEVLNVQKSLEELRILGDVELIRPK